MAASGRARFGLGPPGRDHQRLRAPFDTWASMPQTLWAEDWPEDDRPGPVAYFCGAMDAAWPTEEKGADYLRRCAPKVHAEAVAISTATLSSTSPVRSTRRFHVASAQWG